MRRLVTPVICALLATACSSTGQPRDELMVTDNPVAATPARSPAPTAAPAGDVLALGAEATAAAVTGRTLAVAVRAPAQVRLYDLDGLDRAPRAVALPGPAESLAAVDGALLAALPGQDRLVRVDPATATATELAVAGGPAAATTSAEGTLVALRGRKEVAVVAADGARRAVGGGLLSADQVYAADGAAVVLDRLRNAVFRLDFAEGDLGEGLRAGEGATNGVVDRFGRALVVDTRGGALLAFSLEPMLLRQRYPVPGAPYGIAYDPRRDLAWVTLTATNEVVGFDVAGGEPEERHRFPTVAQPDVVAVDPASGRVIVASAGGGGVQVVGP